MLVVYFVIRVFFFNASKKSVLVSTEIFFSLFCKYFELRFMQVIFKRKINCTAAKKFLAMQHVKKLETHVHSGKNYLHDSTKIIWACSKRNFHTLGPYVPIV